MTDVLTLAEVRATVGTFTSEEPLGGSTGRARFSFFDRGTKVQIYWTFTTVDSDSQLEWRRDGRSPIVWHYFPPTLQHVPIILFVVDRYVWIEDEIWRKGKRLGGKHFDDLSDSDFSLYHTKGGAKPVRAYQKQKPRGRRGRGLDVVHSLEDDFQKRLNLWRHESRNVKPQLAIHRVQDRSLLPDFDAVHWLRECGSYAVLHTPRRKEAAVRLEGKTVKQQKLESDRILKRSKRHTKKRVKLPFKSAKGSAYIVRADGRGAQIQNVDGEYDFRIQIKDRYRPAAYAFEFGVAPATEAAFVDHLVLKVHHDDNVQFSAKFDTSELQLAATVWSKQETQSRLVKSFGEPIKPVASKGWKKRDLEDFGPDALEILYRIATIAVVFIPFGWLAAAALNLAEVVHTYNSGEDFFGNQIGPWELALMGIGVAVDVSIGGVKAVRLAGRAVDISEDASDALRVAFRQVSHELDSAAAGSVAAAQAAGIHPLPQILAGLPEADQKQVVKILTSGATAKKQWELLGPILRAQLNALAADKDNPLLKLLVRSTLLELVTSNGNGLRDALLHAEYLKYLKRTATNKKAAKNPFDWLARTKAKEPVKLLEEMLGSGYAKKIKLAIRPGSKARRTATLITPQNVADTFPYFDEIAEQGLQKYSALRKIWEKLPDDIRDLFLDGFQLEHALEQRFLRNIGRKLKSYEFDALNDLMTTIVPRNQRVARAMFEHKSAPKHIAQIAYTQGAKTRMAAERIPHGAEYLFDAQEIADMTGDVLLRLDADKVFPLDQLYDDVMVLAGAKNAKSVPVIPLSKADLPKHRFDPTRGWPQIGRDKSGGLVVVNSKAVAKARAARAKEAEAILKKQVKARKRPVYNGPDKNGQFSH